MTKILTLAALLCCLSFANTNAQKLDYLGNPCDDCPELPAYDDSNLRSGGYNTFTTIATFNAPTSSPNELAWDGTNIWLCAFGTNVLYRIDPNKVRFMREWALEYHDVPLS